LVLIGEGTLEAARSKMFQLEPELGEALRDETVEVALNDHASAFETELQRGRTQERRLGGNSGSID
jgi:hypothetical protein